MLRKLENRRRRVGNKGFSLVELIIVIAILAVLVAILAPQYLKYVDKSRQSADEANADELLKAVQVAMTDSTIAEAVTSNVTITFDESGVAFTNAPAVLTDELASTLGSDYTTKHVQYTKDANHDVFTITITAATGTVNGSWG